jgi:hypothetical protein
MDSETVLVDELMKGKIQGKIADLKKAMTNLQSQRQKMIVMVDNYETKIIQMEGALIALSELLESDQAKEISKEEVDGSSST